MRRRPPTSALRLWRVLRTFGALVAMLEGAVALHALGPGHPQRAGLLALVPAVTGLTLWLLLRP